MNKAIERMKGGNPLVEDAGEISAYTRETLAMMREARREIYGDQWRDAFEEIAQEFNDDDDDASEGDSLTLAGGDLLMEARGWRRSMTAELVDGFED